MDEHSPAPLISAATLLAQAGAYGLVWLDADFEITAKYGDLVEAIEIGMPMHEAFPALFGYENDIAALVQKPGKTFVLPAISMPTVRLDEAGTIAPRLNITAFWSPPDKRFILLAARASSASNADIETSQQMRKRLMAEEALAQKSKELEIANRDLEEYAEIISHDLSAPLRAIRFLAEDIERALDNADRSEVDRHLSDLKSQTKRMSSMMTALLDYASLGRKTESREAVDTFKLVTEIVRTLPRPKGMSIKVEGNWPTVETMKTPLDLTIRNLIDNAIKHHDRGTGTIRVAASNTDDASMLKFVVSDDGPGIARAHHEAVMLPFRTLTTDGRADTRGMGLALVKRTIDSVGGTLELRSDPPHQRGSSFIVTWPTTVRTRHAPV